MRFLDQPAAGEQWSTGVLGTGFDKLWEQALIPVCLFYSFQGPHCKQAVQSRRGWRCYPRLMAAFFIPQISNAIQAKNIPSLQWSFRSMQYSFIICAFVGVFGGAFFLLTSFYIEEDRKEAQRLWGVCVSWYLLNPDVVTCLDTSHGIVSVTLNHVNVCLMVMPRQSLYKR